MMMRARHQRTSYHRCERREGEMGVVVFGGSERLGSNSICSYVAQVSPFRGLSKRL